VASPRPVNSPRTDDLPDWLLAPDDKPEPPRPRVGTIDRQKILRGEVKIRPAQRFDHINLSNGNIEPTGIPTSETWQQTISHGERHWNDVLGRLQHIAGHLRGVHNTYTWFVPRSVLIDDEGLFLLDEAGIGVRCMPLQAIEHVLHDYHLVAIFGRLEIGDAELRCHVLSMLCGKEDASEGTAGEVNSLELIRLSI